MSTIKYRNALEEDIPIIYGFEANYMKEIEPENYQLWFNAKEKNHSLIQENLRNILVSEYEETIIGHSYWSIIKSEPHIFSIYVSPTFRDKGIARNLLSLIEQEIISMNFKMCFLSTRKNNPAQEFFIKLGYVSWREDNGWIEFKKNISFN